MHAALISLFERMPPARLRHCVSSACHALPPPPRPASSHTHTHRSQMFALGQVTLMVYYVTLCHLFAAITPNMVIGQVFAGITFSLLQLFSGLFIPVAQMGGWQFMYYIVGTSWALKFMALPQFFNNAVFPGSSGAQITQLVFSAGESDIWPSFGWLILIIVVLRFFAFLGYRFINFTRR